MKNKRLYDLSKIITENKLQSMDAKAVKTISGGKKGPTELGLIASCTSKNDCWSFSGDSICTTNDCWGFS